MFKIVYENFWEFAEKLWNKNLKRVINRTFPIMGSLIKWSVQVETPVRTGTLQRGWRMIKWNMQVVVEDRVKYWPFVNNGTRFIKANPFMERGFKKVEGQIRLLLFTALRKEIYK